MFYAVTQGGPHQPDVEVDLAGPFHSFIEAAAVLLDKRERTVLEFVLRERVVIIWHARGKQKRLRRIASVPFADDIFIALRGLHDA